jgi:hypothetical protein
MHGFPCIHHEDNCPILLAEWGIEREAGSTDALRVDDDHEPHPCCRHPRCCPHALAASDAGPTGIDVDRLAKALRIVERTTDEGWPNLHEQTFAQLIAAEYARLSRESDR